jgi:hypothetical protein
MEQLKQFPIGDLLHQGTVGVEEIHGWEFAAVDPADLAEDTIL